MNEFLPKYLNIACGGVYLSSPDWENVDYTADSSGHVRQMDVLHGLSPSQSEYDAVYCSHFIEHVPYSLVNQFLESCFNLVKLGGIFRIVVPDAEFLIREYIKQKDQGNSVFAEFAFINLLDQCVRQSRGGRLGEKYQQIASGKSRDLAEYACYLNGAGGVENPKFGEHKSSLKPEGFETAQSLKRGRAWLSRTYTNIIVSLLPHAFRMQNVSRADVGELHHWMYDFEQMQELLIAAGFRKAVRVDYDKSLLSDWSFLDLDGHKGQPRKGHHQMFIEAMK